MSERKMIVVCIVKLVCCTQYFNIIFIGNMNQLFQHKSLDRLKYTAEYYFFKLLLMKWSHMSAIKYL